MLAQRSYADGLQTTEARERLLQIDTIGSPPTIGTPKIPTTSSTLNGRSFTLRNVVFASGGATRLKNNRQHVQRMTSRLAGTHLLSGLLCPAPTAGE